MGRSVEYDFPVFSYFCFEDVPLRRDDPPVVLVGGRVFQDTKGKEGAQIIDRSVVIAGTENPIQGCKNP